MTYENRFQYLFDQAADIAQATAMSKRLRQQGPRALPPLFFFTDPDRTPRPEEVVVHLPRGSGVVYRHFGETGALGRAKLLKQIADDRGLVLLIGNDADMALKVGADGVHLAERSLDAADVLRQHYPDMLLTAACHSLSALQIPGMQGQKLDAIFASPVFASQSASARGIVPLGIDGIKAMADSAAVPVFALGGINAGNVASLHDCGLSGVAAVDAFSVDDVD